MCLQYRLSGVGMTTERAGLDRVQTRSQLASVYLSQHARDPEMYIKQVRHHEHLIQPHPCILTAPLSTLDYHSRVQILQGSAHFCTIQSQTQCHWYDNDCFYFYLWLTLQILVGRNGSGKSNFFSGKTRRRRRITCQPVDSFYS